MRYFRSAASSEVFSLPDSSDTPNGALPVVVISPEDREQVSSILEDYDKRRGIHSPKPPSVDRVDAMQAALRSLIEPPKPRKPDEPQGLGAVVEDDKGTKWLRHDSVSIHRRWLNTDDCEVRYRSYDEIDAVKVLSEGVQ